MASKSSFLDKVYDVYENVDFASYQQDNLNPVREVKPSIATKSNEDRARDIIASRFNEIQEELQNFGIIPEEEEEDITASTTSESLPDGKTSQELDNFLKAGTSPDSSFILGDPLSDSAINADPLALSIEKLIMEVTIRMNPEDPSKADSDGTSTIPDLVGPPTVDCGDIAPANSDDDNSGDDDDGDEGDGNSDDNSAGSGNSGGSDTDDDDDDDDSDDDSGKSSDDDDPYGTDAALDKALDEQTAADAAEEATILQCAAVELGFLKVILTILQVVTILKKVVSYALNIAYTVIDIVQLAAGAWLNPTNIGKIIQRVVGRVMAIVQNLISTIIKMIWDLLNLDCLSAMAQGYIDQINAALAGINQLKAAMNVNGVAAGIDGLVKKSQEMAQAYEDSFNKLQEAMSDTKSAFNDLKNKYSLSNLAKNLGKACADGAQEGWDSTGGAVWDELSASGKEVADQWNQIFAANKPGVTVLGAESDSN